jgi:hypothetical protein
MFSRHSTCTGGGHSKPIESLAIDVSDSDDPDFVPPRDFNLAEWIGTGRVWTDDMPKSVEHARNIARRVPPQAYAAALPVSNISVANPLQEDAPLLAKAQGAHAAFSSEPVTPTLFDTTWRDSIFAIVAFLPDLRL